MTDLAEHAAGRDRWATSARGPLALVNAQRVDHAQPVWPVPGQWAPAPGGLTVTAVPEDGVLVDGDPVDGTVFVAGDEAVVPSTVVFPDGLAGTVSRGTLRVWDPASDAIARFDRIARFEQSAAWVTSGRYTPGEPGGAASVVDAAGDPLEVAGHVETTLDGAAVRLLAVRSAPFHGVPRLQLIVQDATSALPEDDPGSTYSMGRFLYLDDPGEPADVALDWNLLVLPPCAFSYQFACPIPPAENRIPVSVTAGERHPLDTAGHVFH
ncbi:DUF1684 domain-containing protein [Curtobacterium sp. B18]|uniref:DUF1684 domain-containing protein n=1 Tax=Curtobacterium sp. B18 TaxID=95614 RepID=UPI000347AEF2|nr:DUF1684 domain-containing protein [Curtobacterium sp. B18]